MLRQHAAKDVFRRRLVQTLGVGTITLASGCSGLLDSRQPPYLEEVTVQNKDGVGHEFELTIEQNESVVQETTIELGRSQPPGNVDHVPLKDVDCEWSRRGPYVVTCTLDGDQTEAVRVDTASDDIQQGAGEYAHVTFTVTVEGTLDWSAYLDDGGVRKCSGSPSG